MAIKESKPGCPTWEDEPDTQRARDQMFGVLALIIDQDRRRLPSKAMVLNWHRDLFSGLAPHPDYIGNFRDLNKVPPCLRDAEVHVAGIPGSPADQVLDRV